MTDMPFLGFAPALVPMVKNGIKTMTYRLGDKYAFLKPGDVLLVKNSGNGTVFGEIAITKVSKTTFKNLPIDRNGHESYGSKDDQRKTFETYYSRKIVDEEPVTVLEYKFSV